MKSTLLLSSLLLLLIFSCGESEDSQGNENESVEETLEIKGKITLFLSIISSEVTAGEGNPFCSSSCRKTSKPCAILYEVRKNLPLKKICESEVEDNEYSFKIKNQKKLKDKNIRIEITNYNGETRRLSGKLTDLSKKTLEFDIDPITTVLSPEVEKEENSSSIDNSLLSKIGYFNDLALMCPEIPEGSFLEFLRKKLPYLLSLEGRSFVEKFRDIIKNRGDLRPYTSELNIFCYGNSSGDYYSPGNLEVLGYRTFSIPDKRTYASCLEKNGKIYLIGGYFYDKSNGGRNSHDTILIYDTSSRSFSYSSKMNQKRYLHDAHFLNGGILVYGGNSSESSDDLTSVEHYSFEDNRWSTYADLDMQVRGSSGFFYEGKLYFNGGSHYKSPYSRTIALSFNGDSFQPESMFRLPYDMIYHNVFNIEGNVYLLGTSYVDGGFLKYNFKNNYWDNLFNPEATEIINSLRFKGVTTYKEYIIIASGEHSVTAPSLYDRNTIYSFNTKNGDFKIIGESPIRMGQGNCSVMVGSELFVFGGTGTDNLAYSIKLE